MNSVRTFAQANCILGRALRIERALLYAAYVDWCNNNNALFVGRNKFYNYFEAFYQLPGAAGDGKKFYIGVTLTVPEKLPSDH